MISSEQRAHGIGRLKLLCICEEIEDFALLRVEISVCGDGVSKLKGLLVLLTQEAHGKQVQRGCKRCCNEELLADVHLICEVERADRSGPIPIGPTVQLMIDLKAATTTNNRQIRHKEHELLVLRHHHDAVWYVFHELQDGRRPLATRWAVHVQVRDLDTHKWILLAVHGHLRDLARRLRAATIAIIRGAVTWCSHRRMPAKRQLQTRQLDEVDRNLTLFPHGRPNEDVRQLLQPIKDATYRIQVVSGRRREYVEEEQVLLPPFQKVLVHGGRHPVIRIGEGVQRLHLRVHKEHVLCSLIWIAAQHARCR